MCRLCGKRKIKQQRECHLALPMAWIWFPKYHMVSNRALCHATPLHLFPFYPRDELSSVPSTSTSCLASRSEIHSRLCSYNGGTVRASILFHPLNAVFFFAGAMRCFYGSTDRFCTEYKLCSSSWCQICQRKAIDTFDSEWEKDAWTHLNIW